MQYKLAQINIARMKGVNIQDPIMTEFVVNLDKVNKLAESSTGFIWRLKDDSNNATNLNPYHDEQVIINISVWDNVETLQHFVYNSMHTEFLKKRKEWFHSFGKVFTAMWWIKEGDFPSIDEAKDKLAELQKRGPSPSVFDFRIQFPQPRLFTSVS